MKVKELIEKLQKCDPQATVIVWGLSSPQPEIFISSTVKKKKCGEHIEGFIDCEIFKSETYKRKFNGVMIE